MSLRARPRPYFRVAQLTGNIDARESGHEAGGVRSALGAVLRSRAWGAAPRGTIRVTISIRAWGFSSRALCVRFAL